MSDVFSDLPSRQFIYVIGAGRSGTTMLDILLGNGQDLTSLGELTRYFELDGIPRNVEAGSDKDEFWQSFQQRYEEILGREINFKEFHQRHHRLEHPKQFLQNFFNSRTQEELDLYQQEIQIFLEVLAEKVATPHLVDSSKYAPRALSLAKVFRFNKKNIPFELSFVYLKRDPVSVIQSFGKQVEEQVSRHWLSANIYYFLINFFCRLTVKRLKSWGYKTTQIRYEDYVQNPSEALNKIGNELGVDLQQAVQRIQADEGLEIGPLFDGNRLRLKQEVKLRQSEPVKIQSWVDRFSRVFNFLWY